VTHPSPAQLALESRTLTLRLFRAVDQARADFTRVAEGLALTPLQARTLLFLEEPRAMSQVASHLSCDASNVTGLADRLERLGMIERIPGADRRVKHLGLTDAGKRARRTLIGRLGKETTVMTRLTAGERADLGRLLDRLVGEPG